jgi:hypothetical protein
MGSVDVVVAGVLAGTRAQAAGGVRREPHGRVTSAAGAHLLLLAIVDWEE